MRYRRDLTWLVVIVAIAAVAMRLASATPAEPVPLADREMPDLPESCPVRGGPNTTCPKGSGVSFQFPGGLLPIVELQGAPEGQGLHPNWELARSPDGQHFILACMACGDYATRILRSEMPDLHLNGSVVTRKVRHRTTSETIEFDTGTATIFKKPRAITYAQCGLCEREFVLIIAAPLEDTELGRRAENILMSMRDAVFEDHRTFREQFEEDRKGSR